MKLSISKSKFSRSFYVTKSLYNRDTKTYSSTVIERLGTEKELRDKHHVDDAEAWARAYVDELNRKEKAEHPELIARFTTAAQLPKDQVVRYRGGYLFLQQLTSQLGLKKICQTIKERHQFTYDLHEILSTLIYTRLLYPGSKQAALVDAQTFLEAPGCQAHQIYRALDVLAQESDFIQAQLYKNSLKLRPRNHQVLYYDCTNYYFEIEQDSGNRKYGHSKEHRPNPLLQMGLFIDGDGLPLAFRIFPGNQNEQTSLKPLEETILQDFDLSQFIVCTDAGLASQANRRFNHQGQRAYVTTKSLKQLPVHLKDWALDPTGWHRTGSKGAFNLTELNDDPGSDDHKHTYYKDRWIHENGLEEHLVITFSFKHRDYQRSVREQQILRAQAMQQHPQTVLRSRQTDPKRFLVIDALTPEGELADKKQVRFNPAVAEREALYDGFYGVVTDLEGDPEQIVRINQGRWQIEQCFRIMKSEFKARPAYLSRDKRLEAHFMTCFIALLVYRQLEHRVAAVNPGTGPFCGAQIMQQLRQMDFYRLQGQGYIPLYARNDLTDALHKQAGFRTDYQALTLQEMKKVIAKTKKP